MIGWRQFRQENPGLGLADWLPHVRYTLGAQVRHRVGLHNWRLVGAVAERERCDWCGAWRGAAS